MVDLPRELVIEPGQLVGVEHRPPVGLEHPGGTRVDHDEPTVAQVAPVAPAVHLRMPVDTVNEVEHSIRQVELVVALMVEHRTVDEVCGQLAR